MAVNFPTSLDTITNNSTVIDADHVKTLQAKVGANSSAVTTSHDYKLSGVTGSDKAVSETGTETLTNKTLTSPVINTGISGTAILDEDNMASNSATKLATQQSIKAYVDARASTDGWIDSTAETWVYASASTFTVAGVDVTAKYQKGTKLKWTQTTVKYGVVVNVSFSTNTTVTIAVNDEYVITNAAISANYYSYQSLPQGFPDWFSFNNLLVWTGFSSAQTNTTTKYRIDGRKCEVIYRINATGTSNANSLTCTGFPVTPLTTRSRESYGIYMDNGTTAEPALGEFSGTGITWSKASATSDTTWTTSGGKGIYSFHCTFDW